MLAEQVRWDMDADVVIIGYGGGGAVAAIAAHDTGAQVLALEKQGLTEGVKKGEKILITNTFTAGGGFISPSDVQGAIKYQEAYNKVADNVYWTNPDVMEVWAKYAVENLKWFESLGGSAEISWHGGAHKVPGFESIDSYHARGNGPGFMRVFYNQCEARKIPVMYNTPAIDLLENAKGEVIGVRAKKELDGGKIINVQARRAVILASGGFACNEPMKLQYLKVYPMSFESVPALTGEGIRMAMEIGADLWHMNCWAACFNMQFPGFPFGFLVGFGGQNWVTSRRCALPDFGLTREASAKKDAVVGYMVVDRYGRRYVDEDYGIATTHEMLGYESKKRFYPRVPSYWIMDQTRIDHSPISKVNSGAAGPCGLYRWSPDNSVEIEKGWIKRADTVKELADILGMEDPQVLVETVNNYNSYCQHGDDRECGRIPRSLIPLNNPPYYTAEVGAGGANTLGGPRRNAKSQVIRVDGNPIPRLFVNGECGSIFGMSYLWGMNLSEVIAYGRVAGENAAKYPPL
jgi:succinate dehydrogenase/fumarate reductase flavoprotein subunit